MRTDRASTDSARRDERRREIRAAALRRFAESSYEEATLEQIAGDVGIKRPTVIGAVGRKEDLYAECLEEAGQRLNEALSRVAKSSEPKQALTATVVAIAAFAENEPEAWSLVERHLLVGTGQFAEASSRIRAAVCERICWALAESSSTSRGDLTYLALAVLGAARAVLSSELHPDRRVHLEAVEALWEGMSGRLNESLRSVAS